MQFLVAEIHRIFRLRAKPCLSFQIILFKVELSFFAKFSLDLDRHLVVRLVEYHLWLELYGCHSAKTICLHLDLIIRLLGISGLRRAFLFALALFTHDEEDRAGDDEQKCAHENLSHDSSPLSIFKFVSGDWLAHSLARRRFPLKS